MSETFEFKPAPLARPIQVEVGAAGAIIRSSKGKVKARLDFSTARRLRFAEMHTRGIASRWFDVHHARGRFRLHCNSGSTDDPHRGHLAEYRAAVQSILLGMESRTPGLQVEVGPGRGTEIAMFVMGLCAALFGVIVPIVALTSDVDPSRLYAGVGGSLAMLVIGVSLMLTFRPWEGGTRIQAGALARSLSRDPADAPEEA